MRGSYAFVAFLVLLGVGLKNVLEDIDAISSEQKHIELDKSVPSHVHAIRDWNVARNQRSEYSSSLMNIKKETNVEISSDVKSNLSEIPQMWSYSPDVVIVTKIHGEEFLPELKQSLCLLDAAYNSRVRLDIVIFHTLQIPEEEKRILTTVVSPASLRFVMDEKSLLQQISDLTPEQQQTLVDRCQGVNRSTDLTWYTRCKDGTHVMPIAYCWMSEFRAKHIWTHNALRSYKYMLWWDSDTFPTKKWQHDPVYYMLRNDLVLLMANYGLGNTPGGYGVQQKIFQAYNKTLCSVELLQNGRLRGNYGDAENCAQHGVRHVHGFFHITNLAFYRLPQNLKWYNIEIGNQKFSRIWDDQLAVIIPAVMLAPNRTVEMHRVGIHLEVMHNAKMMGKVKWGDGAYKQFWNLSAPTDFPEAVKKCSSYVVKGSRR
jgi:hypothetical protein